MMRFSYPSVFTVVFSVAMGGGELHAQPVPGIGASGASPAYSPYLNLLRNSTTSNLNYFSLVRPQLQTNQALQNLNNEMTQRQAEDQAGGGLSGTGHPTQFLNYGGYFLSNNGTGSRGAGGTGTGGLGATQSGGSMRAGGGQGGATPGGAAGGGLAR